MCTVVSLTSKDHSRVNDHGQREDSEWYSSVTASAVSHAETCITAFERVLP